MGALPFGSCHFDFLSLDSVKPHAQGSSPLGDVSCQYLCCKEWLSL